PPHARRSPERARPQAQPPRPRPRGSAFAPIRSRLDRQSDVILGKRASRCRRAGDIIKLGELALAIECVVNGIEMKQLRHPPGEALRLPDAPQACRRIAIEELAVSGA